ncbi:hypothetical protein ACNKHO_24350 [Shigella flexneri]
MTLLRYAGLLCVAVKSQPGEPGASAFLRCAVLRLAGEPGQPAANPAKGIATPKAPRHLPKNIDVDDVNRLLDIDLYDPKRPCATAQCWK